MENFAFQQFLGQIYQVKPELRQYDEHVRQFLRDELNGKKSFTIDQSVVAKVEAYVQKRLDVTKVGNQVLNNEAMLFDKEKVTVQLEPKSLSKSKDEKKSSSAKHVVNSMPEVDDIPSKGNTVAAFLRGFILGALMFTGVMVYVSTLPEYQTLIKSLMMSAG